MLTCAHRLFRPLAMKTRIVGAKIACLDINLTKQRMHLGVHITIDDPSQLEEIRKRESEITLEKIRKILASGANVILTTKGIDDLCLKEFIEAGAMAVRRCRKEDLRRIAKATGATLVSSLANLDGDETFEKEYLGHAEEVVQERISDDELILVKGTKVVNSSSIILRGANGQSISDLLSLVSLNAVAYPSYPLCSPDYMLDEMERALHDSLCVIKRTLESGAVVPGGGAVEAALSIYLENFATTLVSPSSPGLVSVSFLLGHQICERSGQGRSTHDATSSLLARPTSGLVLPRSSPKERADRGPVHPSNRI